MWPVQHTYLTAGLLQVTVAPPWIDGALRRAAATIVSATGSSATVITSVRAHSSEARFRISGVLAELRFDPRVQPNEVGVACARV